MSTQTDTPIQELLFAAMAAKAVGAAAELGVFDALADRPRTSAQLAAVIGAHEPSLRRLLQALAGVGVVALDDDGRFEPAPAGRALCAASPDSVHDLVTMLCGPEYWRAWGELVPAVRTGERAWDRALGATWLEYNAGNPGAARTFDGAMAEHARDAAPGLVAHADLGRFGTVVDVGGGRGTLLAEALRAHPELRGTLLDLPGALEGAPATLQAAGVHERCRIVAGDFFAAVPPGADAYLLKQVIHDWDDDAAVAVLRTVRAAAGDRGRLLVLERELPERPGPSDLPVLLVDLLMLLVTGGRERTRAELGDLLAAAGFALADVSDPIPPFDYRVAEATPV
jgi:hypothetical protein